MEKEVYSTKNHGKKDKNLKEAYGYRIVLGFLTLVLVLISLSFFGIAYLHSNPLEFKSEVTEKSKQVLGKLETSVKENNSIIIDEAETSKASFLRNISSPYPVRSLDDNAYFKIRTIKEILIINLNKEDKVEIMHYLPLAADNINLYDNRSLIYSVKDPAFGSDTLFVKEKDKSAIDLYEFSPTESIVSIYYLPETQEIYGLVRNIENKYSIYSITLEGRASLIYSDGSFSDSSWLSYINPQNNDIFIKSPNRCYQLGVQTKSLTELRCEFVKQNQDNLLFKHLTKQIESYNAVSSETVRLVEIPEGRRVQNLFYRDGHLYYVQYELLNPLTKVFHDIQINSKVDSLANEDLPFGEDMPLMLFDFKLYLVDEESVGSRLVKYVKDPKEIIKEKHINTTEPDWYEVDLDINDIVEIELIYPLYF